MLAALRGDDIILCQITGQMRSDGYSVQLESADFTSGGLNQSSRIRPNRLFTAEEGIVVYRAGHVSDGKLNQALDHLIDILRQP